MALKKQHKVAIGLGLLAVVGVGVGVAVAANKKPKAAGAPPDQDEEVDDDDDDDDALQDLPSEVTAPPPFVVQPPTAPVGPPVIIQPPVGPPIVVSPPTAPTAPVVGPPPFFGGPVPGPIPDDLLDDGDDIDPIVVELPGRPPIAVPVPSAPPPVFTNFPVIDPRPILDTLPQPAPVAPPEVVNAVTAAMVQELLAAERKQNWKRKFESVRAWQNLKGRTRDAMFGPGDALQLALEVGTIPIIRFWPSATGVNPQQALDDYRAGLMEIAQQRTPQHAGELIASADRERGQSFGAPFGTGGKGPIV